MEIGFLWTWILSRCYPPYCRLIFDLIMHFIEYVMHTSGHTSKLRKHFVCLLFFSLGSAQFHFIIHILGSDWLGSSCPVNCKQSSFIGLLISNNGYQPTLMITVLFCIELHSNSKFKNLPGDQRQYSSLIKRKMHNRCFKT